MTGGWQRASIFIIGVPVLGGIGWVLVGERRQEKAGSQPGMAPCFPASLPTGSPAVQGPRACYCFSFFSKSTVLLSLREPLLALLACWGEEGRTKGQDGVDSGS